MTGTPTAFQPSAFDNDAFQTGDPVLAVPDSGGGGGSSEADFEGYKARRRARLREIETQERERERIKLKIAETVKKTAPKRQRGLSERLKRELSEKLAKYDRQIADLDSRIAAALAELAKLNRIEIEMAAAIADRRRRLMLVALAAA